MLSFIIFFYLNLQVKTLPVVNSVIDKSLEYYESSIEGYKKNEFWGDWAVPVSNILKSSSTKKTAGKISYSVKNIQDYDLNTAWVPDTTNSQINPSFEFIFNFPKNTNYAGAYQFLGICNLFNGYCKSLKAWEENSRVKKLLVYYNDTPICYINLVDTWHFQSFDISKFFKNKRDRKNLNAQYEIRNGDRLKFEIIEIYKGKRYNDVAISEFLCEGGTN